MIKVQSAGQTLWEGKASNGMEFRKDLSKTRKLVGLKFGEQILDLHMPLSDSEAYEAIYMDSPEGLDFVRHSCAHILAQAVQQLYENVQVTIGPVIDNGFFYDFATDKPFTLEDLPAIEKKMKKIVAQNHELKREEWPVEKAIVFFDERGEKFKTEIIQDLQKNEGVKTVSLYWQGDWVDLCRGPHVPKTGDIPALKLMSVAGAYWRGDEKNPMLSRIYGTAFTDKEELSKYLFQIEEAKKRDHRKLGVEMELFSFHEEAPASPFFHKNGAIVYEAVKDVLTELNQANGFETVLSPLMMSEKLWKASGHYDNYKENMYFTQVDDQNFAVKPMNCPGHCLIYGNQRHSYRELPIRYAEFGRVHRHERSGVVAGLFRVRSFVQDDAHVYCTEEQIEGEIIRILEMIRKFYSLFGFSYQIELSTRPEKRIGAEEVWDRSEAALKSALETAGETYKINPGDGAFYGPKIDFHLNDSLGRTHQCGTVQLDFSMPDRFGLGYTGADNAKHTPVMIHRAIAGSLERFLGILIEHYGGKFPLWLAPLQLVVMTVTEEAGTLAQKLFDEAKSRGYRVVLDDSNDKLGAKIKRHRKFKVPYMVILGAQEVENSNVSLRKEDGSQVSGLSIDEFFSELESLQRNKF
ncbi:threonine--tRNA ligase [bacterium]|nr:threonine--tRNA ligase [bacterium]